MSNVQGLNEYFIATDSLANRERREYGAYEFNSETYGNVIGARAIQDASITNAKIGTAAIGTANIGTLSFNEITGGTARIGGTSNGNGVISVRDAGGTEKVLISNNGIEINDGKITIRNTGGGTAFDSKGVVSEQNFFTSAAQLTAYGTQQITSYSLTDIIGGSITFVTDRTRMISVNAMFGFWIQDQSGVFTDFRGFCWNTYSIDGTVSGWVGESEAGYYAGHGGYGATSLTNQSFNAVFSLGPGTHVLKLQSALSQESIKVGTPIERIYAFRLNYTLLGT